MRQETTIFMAGTLPLNMYEQNEMSIAKISVARSEEDEAFEGRELNHAPEYFQQESEYDTDSSVDDLDIDEFNVMQLDDED